METVIIDTDVILDFFSAENLFRINILTYHRDDPFKNVYNN